MQLTQAADYSFRVILYLSHLKPGEIATAKTIAEHEEIPMRYLLKIIRSLVKSGILNSYRGIEGGYGIAKTPDQINFLDVIEAVDGPIQINRCLEDKSYCSKHWCESCPVHQAFNTIQANLISDLKSYNIAVLLKEKSI